MLVLAGIVVGAPAAFFVSRLVGSQLYDMTPHDPITIVLAVLSLSTVALAAGCIPARRASRVNPIVALRSE
jgi:ABC-type antimicrobial peptide transport system permease subunit